MSKDTENIVGISGKIRLNVFKGNFKPKKRDLEANNLPELKKLQNDYQVLEEYQAHTPALECLDKILEIKPNDPSTLFNKGVVLLVLEKWEDALDCFNLKIVSVKDNADTWINRGVCLAKLQKFDLAQKSFAKAIKIVPNNEGLYVARAQALFDFGEPEEAIEVLNDAIKIKPERYVLRLAKAKILHNMKFYEDAIPECDKAIEIALGSGLYEPYLIKAACLTELGNMEEGNRFYDKAEELGWTPSSTFRWDLDL